MENIEVTSMSSRGQVVIPQKLRESLRLKEGEKFMVIGEDGTLVFKKLDVPSFDEFEKLIKKTREFVKEKNIEESNIKEAIDQSRKI